MRYLILFLVGLALALPTVAGASPNASRHNTGGKQYAFLGLKHSNKAKKQPKAKKGKKSSKKAPRSKSSH